MALRLKIVSDNAATAGEHARWTFGVNGGRIGRHTTNDWVLRDPERYVSGRHAEIEHRGGAWLLRDTSTNGTFVNASDEALGPDRLHELSNGDRFRIGEYEIEVEITGGNDFPAQESAPVSQTDLDSSFEVKNFISTGRREREAQACAPVPRAEAPPRPDRAAARAAPPPAPAWLRARAHDQELWPGLAVALQGRRHRPDRAARRGARHRARAGGAAAARNARRLLRARAHARGLRERVRHLLRGAPPRRDRRVHAHRRRRTGPRADARGQGAGRRARRRRDPRAVRARAPARDRDVGGAARGARRPCSRS